MEFSDISKKLTKKIPTNEKKNDGIYFTPPNIISKNLEFLNKYMTSIKHILEPSCGSGEYLTMINSSYPDKKITAIEFNKKIL